MSVILFIAHSITDYKPLSTPFTEFMEVPKGSPQMVIHPKPPLPVGATAQEDGPSTLGWNLKAVTLLATAPPDGRGFDMPIAIRSTIRIVPLDKDTQEIASVVVEVRTHVRSNPVMDADRVTKCDESPPSQVVLITLIHLLLPSYLK